MNHRFPISRREFLKRLSMFASGLTLASCGREAVIPTNPPAVSASPTPFAPDLQPTISPSLTATTPPQATSTPIPGTPVAVNKITTYDPTALRRTIGQMLENTGFYQQVRPGARIGIKANLTGGAFYDSPDKPAAIDTYVTHPVVVGVLGELCRDAGAKSIYVVDGLGDARNWEAWGYAEMAGPIDAQLVDLCHPDPYADFVQFPVGDNFLIYETFSMNPVLQDVDVFISVAKMKMHHTTGITLSLKNMVGITPIALYRRYEQENNRSALHEEIGGFDQRMPRVIIDLNRARPVDYAVVDGIFTCEGGAGPWDAYMSPIQPGLLFAGPDPVAVDAVAAAAMGVDPEGETGTSPYLHGENHLTLAWEAGLGTNRLDEISILGEKVEDVRIGFKPVP